MNIARHEPFNMLTNAVVHDGIIYTTGLTAKDASGDVKTQTVQVLEEIDRLLALCGSKKSKIRTAMIWLTDIKDRAAMNEAWVAWADKANLPARACVEARLADPAWRVEIMITAAI